MTQRRTQAKRRDDTRTRLLEAAYRVFARDGAAAAVGDIATEASCSTGAIYSHFSGKYDLMLAVFDARFSNWVNSYATAISQVDSPAGVIDAVTSHWQQLLEDDPLQMRLYVEFWMASLRDETLRAAFCQRQTQLINAMSVLIVGQLAAIGIDSPVPAVIVGSVVTALADGLAIQSLAGTIDDAAENLRTALHLLRDGLLMQAGSRTDEPTQEC
jgi:AcrR family transcriptional regulator